MYKSTISLTLTSILLLTGCTTFNKPQPVGTIPCVYRFKMLSRPEDRTRVEAAIRKVAVGNVVQSGTSAYPEYRFRVARLADLDTLHPELMYHTRKHWLNYEHLQTLNLRTAGVEAVFDSTDVSAVTTTTITFNVKPGSRLYYKHPGGPESDITARIDQQGRVSFPVTVKEGQRYIYARAVKEQVTRYIRINIFTSEIADIAAKNY